MGLETPREQKVYLQVIADGSIRKVVPEGTPGAVKREYEDRETKEVKHKFELVYSAINGIIGKVTINKGKYGDQLIIPITDGDETFTLALSTSQNYGEDFMKKMPNINFEKPVRLAPFSFTSDQGKIIRGIDVRQDWNPHEPVTADNGNKIPSNYFDPMAKRNINGYPDPEGNTRDFSTDDWKIYFAIARKFLVGDLKTKGLIVDSATAGATTSVAAKEIVPDIEYPEDEINPEDIPF